MKSTHLPKIIQILTYSIGFALLVFLFKPAVQVVDYAKTLHFQAPEKQQTP